MKKVVYGLFFSIFLFNEIITQVSAEGTVGVLPNKTDFLTLIQGIDLVTTYYPTTTSANRTAYRNKLKSLGYTHAYISVTSSKTGHNGYADPQGFKVYLQELVNDGIKPVVWLTSDTGTWKDKSISAIKTDLSNFVPVVDSLVNSYEVGLEADEYWTKSESDQIGSHLDSLTSKPLASHQLPGKWDYCSSSWCDYMILQYGFGKTESAIITMTNNARNSLGKPIVAGEYNTNQNGSYDSDGYNILSKDLGDAALSACAAGFGNGGTPSEITWPNCGSPTPTSTSVNSPTPTSSVNQAPIANDRNYTTAVNQQIEQAFSYDDPDSGPGPYTYTITNPPDHGNIDSNSIDNDWIYTPNTNYSGTDSFQWQVDDGANTNSLSNIAAVTINIQAVSYDGISYVNWLKNYGKSLSGGASVGDFDGNSTINLFDYRVWINNY